MPFLTVGDIMTRPATAVNNQETVADVYRVMMDKNCRHVPVINSDHEIMGIVSDRDLMQALMSEEISISGVGERILLLQEHPVTAVMTPDPECVDIDVPLNTACQLMLDNKFDALPVLDGNRLAGMITSTDIIRAMAQSNTAQI